MFRELYSILIPECLENYGILIPECLENYSILVSECSMDGSWTPPHLNCYFDPVAAANNLKKVRHAMYIVQCT